MERWPWPSLDSFTMPFARQFLRLNLLMITLPFDLVIDLLQIVYIATKFIADGSSVVTDLEYKERPTRPQSMRRVTSTRSLNSAPYPKIVIWTLGASWKGPPLEVSRSCAGLTRLHDFSEFSADRSSVVTASWSSFAKI